MVQVSARHRSRNGHREPSARAQAVVLALGADAVRVLLRRRAAEEKARERRRRIVAGAAVATLLAALAGWRVADARH